MEQQSIIALSFANVKTLYFKEMRSYFNSPVAYVVIVVFLSLVGYFFTSTLFIANVASLRTLFELVPAIFLFVVPAVTMRLLSEELKSGTIELLTTRPIHDSEIILAKFLAAWSLLAAALFPTLLYYVAVASLGAVDMGPAVGGYIGLLLLAGAYTAVGLFASGLTQNQIVAFIFGFLFIFTLYLLDKILVFLPPLLAGIAAYLGADAHFSSIARGVVDTRDIVYFVSVIGVFLYGAVITLERRTW